MFNRRTGQLHAFTLKRAFRRVAGRHRDRATHSSHNGSTEYVILTEMSSEELDSAIAAAKRSNGVGHLPLLADFVRYLEDNYPLTFIETAAPPKNIKCSNYDRLE